MDTRILKMTERSVLRGDRSRHVRGLGQLQPVIFFWKNGDIWLRIEGAVERHGVYTWGYWSYRLNDPAQKKRAKIQFAHLEQCKRDGTRSLAMQLWEDHEQKRDRA